ncbi:MAG TPA: helix-turn-helix domain-containing protein [Mycobacteriales bacterium]|nr:helix-turn-helix domain-containing protein [Mycobacteriales bacterium]
MLEESAGQLVRTARKKAGLSQSELAARAGLTQSVISVYESGRRQPALPTLAALVAAAGYRLDVRLRRSDQPGSAISGPLGRRLRRHRAQLKRIAATEGVRVLGVFGSVARGEERPDSDIDLLVELPAEISLLQLGRLAERCQGLLGAAVDLVPEPDLKAGVRPRVLAELISL